MTDMSDALVAAYRETDYIVADVPPFVLRIGLRSVPLVAAHARWGVACSAFITACNPFSQPLSEVDNVERQAALAGVLRERGLPFIDGMGRHPTNGWPGELSFLVPGLSREDACALGRQFQQNAIVWCGEDAVAELVTLV